MLSGKDGSFLYAFPYFTGNPELHIAEASDSSLNHIVLLASEFCNKAIRLPYLPLLIDSLEQSAVRETLVNIQLKERYRQDSDGIDLGESSSPAFYGSGASVTYVKDYIELADLGEFIYEIIPQVSVNSNSEGSFIRIQGPSCMEIYPPLVLMDNVPVPNNDELLNIPSNRIERIEVLNQAYMVGNIRYSGILSVYSGKKDMSRLEFCVEIAKGEECIELPAPGGESMASERLVLDPVCGKWLDLRQVQAGIEYEGNVYHVCCPLCQEAFEHEPARYARTG